jgi:hypothetical protein
VVDTDRLDELRERLLTPEQPAADSSGQHD